MKEITKKKVKEIKQTIPKLFIATPMYGGMCSGFYAQSMLQLKDQVGGKFPIIMSFMFNESLITRARNAMAHQFLKTDATHLMFIDADIRFNPADIETMIAANKDIICGIYPKKEINWGSVKAAMSNGVPDDQLKHHTGAWVVNLKNYTGETTVRVDQPVEIWNGGTGFMLIKREVFKKLGKTVPSYTNDVNDLSGNLKAEVIKEYFTTSIEKETNRLLSEDYHFCNIWREAGGKVWAAPWCNLAHIGSYVFEGQLLRSK